jgi:ubiquinone/menaquinone biosynthesis C-methylase UbiE
LNPVVRYYDLHPINEESILAKLKASGADVARLTVERLKEFDQDHYGGIAAVDTLIEHAGIRAQQAVLDACSGVGGPARWIAHRIGCKVTGLDLTASRVEAARRLTRRVRLENLATFVQGDATAMPFADASFDIIVGQEAWVHVPDKAALIAECTRVARPGATIAFTDIVARKPLSAEDAKGLTWAIQAAEAATPQFYVQALKKLRWRVRECEDLGEEWTRILVGRLAMYRSLRDTTVAKFGLEHYEDWDRRYAFFVDLYAKGKLSGARIVARM